MAVWPGGHCPDCGEEVPANVVRCRTCGRILNSDLDIPIIVSPTPLDLPELTPMQEATPRGLFVGCPNCEKELRISRKFLGHHVQCKFCTAPFEFKLNNAAIQMYAVYADCPHCQKEIRVAMKYLNLRVACKQCDGPLRVLPVGP